MQTIKFKNN